MKKKLTFAVIGGDLRQVTLASMLLNDGYGVNITGFDKDIKLPPDLKYCDCLSSAVKDANVIVLPLPYSTDGIYINAPFSVGRIPVAELMQYITPDQFVAGGKLDHKIYEFAKELTFKITDYLERDELAILNAIPTAEGAIGIAMNEIPTTLHGSNCLVLGFGRVGRILAKGLYGLGANVFVEARKFSDLAYIKAYSYTPVPLHSLEDFIPTADIIFNSIPAMLLDSNMLKTIKNGALVIDLASKPGGVDFDKARELGIKVIWALSLPGKVAPTTSGEIIKDTVLNILKEENLL